MSRFAVDHLSPLAARRRLDEVDLEEKSRLAEGLALIALIDERGDYLEAGYSSMQRYCIEHMHMSDATTLRRLQAARLGRKFPQVFERIADGRLTLTNACEIAPILTKEDAEWLLDAVVHQPKLQVRRIVIEATRAKAPAASSPAPATEQGEPSIGAPASAPEVSLSELCGLDSHDTALTEHALAHVNLHVRGRVFETKEGERGLNVVLTDDEFANFKKAQDLLAHVVRNGDPAVIVPRALALFARKLETARYGAKGGATKVKRVPRGRDIPAALRHEVAERDEYCCSFVGPDGHRCGETRGVQFDHVTPVALGGETTAENLRLLCPSHNRHEARKKLGAEHVAAQRELNERARALQKETKAREAERAASRGAQASADADVQAVADAELQSDSDVRDLARRESDLDTIAALRTLGCTLEQARLAAWRTAALADGPLEQRVHAAIKSRGRGLGRKEGVRQPEPAPSALSDQAA